MNYDLKIIKEKYGEKMMHLCRTLFPTLLEEPGLLSRLMLQSFAPSKLLYDHITEKYRKYLEYGEDKETVQTDRYRAKFVEKDNVENFKNYIYGLVNKTPELQTEITKTPEELLDEAGYILYECHTEEDIQQFKKYYAPGEELCTFKGGRLKNCIVFFAVKKNVDQIRRKNFINPDRQDEYGTSVISIQFSRGNLNTLSIINRYNHSVNNADATFNNNLENIIPGLTKAFEKKYKLSINQARVAEFELPGFVLAADGKYYKYNYEINNVYYCPNNIIIDNFVVKEYPKEKYLIVDYFIIDLVNETISLYDKSIEDSFIDGIWNIKKISIIKKETNEKTILIETQTKNIIEIEIDKNNKIIGYKNDRLTKVGDNFLSKNKSLKSISLKSLKKIGKYFLNENDSLLELSLPNLKEIGYGFMWKNVLEKFEAPKLRFVNDLYNPEGILNKLTTNQKVMVMPIRDTCEKIFEEINKNSLLSHDESLIVRTSRTKKLLTNKIKILISSAYKHKEKIKKGRKK